MSYRNLIDLKIRTKCFYCDKEAEFIYMNYNFLFIKVRYICKNHKEIYVLSMSTRFEKEVYFTNKLRETLRKPFEMNKHFKLRRKK